MGFKKRTILVMFAFALAVAGLVLSLVKPARATFPGRNGRIAFHEATDVNNVYTINPDGTDERQLTSFGPDNTTFGVAWSPDGRQLVFGAESANFSSPGQIWVMNADGSNQHMVFNDPGFFDFTPAFSPDGKHIAFSRCAVGCAIYRIRADGSELTAITKFDPNPEVVDEAPAYSPDGEHIAFRSFIRDGVLEAVYLMDADGSHIHRLTTPELGASQPDWSPDGEKIVFYTNDPSCTGCFFPSPEIWEIGADGTGLRRLAADPNLFDLSASWAPQGNAIVFEKDDPSGTTSQLFLLNVNEEGANSSLLRNVFHPKSRFASEEQRKRNGSSRRRTRLIEGDGFTPQWGSSPR